MKEKCIAKDCARKVEVKKHGLCRAHAERLYTGREVHGALVKRKRKKNRSLKSFLMD